MKIYLAAFFASLTVGLSVVVFVLDTDHAQSIVSSLSTSEQTEQEPAAILAMAPGDKFADEFDYLLRAMGLKSFYSGIIMAGVEKSLSGLDRTRPLGALCYFDEDEEEAEYAIGLPIHDWDEFVQSIQGLGRFAETENGTTFIPGGGLAKEPLWVKQLDDYVFISNQKTLFDRLPSDPEKLFNSVVASRTLAITVFGRRIPDWQKNQFWAQVKKGAKSARAAANSQAQVEYSLKMIQGLIFDVEQFSLAMDLNQKTWNILIDTKIEGTQDSWISERSNKNLAMAPSQFVGFRKKNAGLNLNVCSNTNSEDIRAIRDNLVSAIEKNRRAGRKSQPQQPPWLNELATAFDKMLESERVDFGATIDSRDGKPSWALGMYVPERSHFDTIVQQWVDEIKSNNDPTKFRTNFAIHREIVFHEFKGRIAADKKMEEIFGETTKVIVGIAEQAVYIGVGENSFELLKGCIDDSADAQQNHPVLTHGQIKLQPWIDFLDESESDNRYIKSVVRNTKGFDRLRFESQPIENGFVSTTIIDYGFLRTCFKTGERAIQRMSNKGPVRVDSAPTMSRIPFSSMMRSN